MRTRGVVVRQAGAPAALEEIELDPPGAGEVLVRVVATGVCHSDLHAKLGHFGSEFPYLLGHEATAVIEEVGQGVPAARVGETVVLCWRAPCTRCRFCVAGQAELCARPVTAAPRMRTLDGAVLGRVLGLGTFCSHTVVAAAQALPIAAELRPEATCLIGCGVATGVGAVLRAAKVRAGATVAVFGCGAVGLSVIQGARLAHASRILAVDLVPRKLDWARAFGATDLVDAREGDPAKRIRALTKYGVDYAFEAIGLPEPLAQALASCDLGGVCTLIGVPQPTAELTLSLARFFYGRLQLRATFYGDCLPARDFPLLADLYRRGQLDLDGLVTHRLGLDEVEAAFTLMQNGESLRAVIRP